MKQFHRIIQPAAGIVLALLGVTLAFGTECGAASALEMDLRSVLQSDASPDRNRRPIPPATAAPRL